MYKQAYSWKIAIWKSLELSEENTDNYDPYLKLQNKASKDENKTSYS